jgi:pimeloyl-ACP methyl ester carboxylesterase
MKSFDFGGTGQPLHFLHANGYPPDCYKPLFELLKTEYHVFGMLLRPLWGDAKPEEIKDWVPFSDDLLGFLASSASDFDGTSQPASQKVIGVGHSIGAMVTLRTALREPDKFKALVLIDPVLFMPRRLIAWHIARAIGLGNQLHPKISGALKRRRTFDNLENVIRGYRNRDVFRYMSDENLRIYIEGITRKSDSGYELAYSPEWEARIYFTGLRDFDIWRGLPKLGVPTLFIRGAESDTFLEDAARLVHRTASRVKQKQPKVRVETLEKSTHILPLERPKEVFEIMQLFLNETLKV